MTCHIMSNGSLKHSYILEYIIEIEKGNIIVGEELKIQLEKLKRELTDPIYQNLKKIEIDINESEKRIAFIEKECKHYQAPYAGKPFILELFQKWIVEATFAIKIWDDEIKKYVRKYKNVLFLVARKNGKSPFISAIALSEWFCGPIGGNILCCSNSYEQADIMYQGIDAMREESRTLEKVTHRNQKGIFFGNQKRKKAKGKFSYQNKGSIKKLSKKTGAKEGKNISVGMVDEVHEMEDDSLVMPVRQALSTQDEPLFFELTTEGFVNDGYLDKRLEDARKVLYGEVEDERWLIVLYTQDSEEEIWQDEKSWQKSNPAIGKFKKYSFLREMLQAAKRDTSTKAFVLAKDFNFKQNNASAWLDKETIENNLEADLEDFRGMFAIGGADLSETNDLTNARVLFFNPETKDKTTFSMYFIPSSKLEELDRDEKEKFIEWIKQGYIYVCEGSEVEQSDVVAWFVSLYKKYKIRVVCTGYDKWQAKAFAKEMDDYGFDLEKIGQGDQLSNAMGVLEGDLRNKKLNYAQNPVDKFCLQNVCAKWNSEGTKRKPIKVQNDDSKKIDGAITMLICYETLDRYRTEYCEYVRR